MKFSIESRYEFRGQRYQNNSQRELERALNQFEASTNIPNYYQFHGLNAPYFILPPFLITPSLTYFWVILNPFPFFLDLLRARTELELETEV